MKRILLLIFIALGITASIQAQFITQTIDRSKKSDIAKINTLRPETKATSGISIADIVGTYEAYGVSAFENSEDEVWQVAITQDGQNPNKVWIQPICLFGGLEAENINPVYAIFDKENSSLIMPLGQCLFGGNTSRYNMVTATIDDYGNPVTSDNYIINITKSELEISLLGLNIFGVGNINANEWWYQAFIGFIYTKDLEVEAINIHIKGETEPTRLAVDKLYFPIVDNKAYITDAPAVSDKISGSYTALGIGTSGNDSENWSVNITEDEQDPNKIWIHPIFTIQSISNDDIKPVYAIYNANTNTYELPLGQTILDDKSVPIHLDIASVDSEGNTVLTGSTSISIEYDGITRLFYGEDIFGYGSIKGNILSYHTFASILYYAGPSLAIPIEEVEKITKTTAPKEEDWVDLGLSSGTLWAKQNLGATSIYDPGIYLAWGELTPKTEYTFENYFDKYGKIFNTSKNKSLIGTEYDAARQLLGEEWVMPSREQAVELYMECTWTWKNNYNNSGVSGCVVTGPNGNQIFLPAGGLMMNNEHSWKTSGNIWIGTLNNYNNTDWACFMDFTSNGPSFQYVPYGNSYLYVSQDYRWWGRNVRAVRKK